MSVVPLNGDTSIIPPRCSTQFNRPWEARNPYCSGPEHRGHFVTTGSIRPSGEAMLLPRVGRSAWYFFVCCAKMSALLGDRWSNRVRCGRRWVSGPCSRASQCFLGHRPSARCSTATPARTRLLRQLVSKPSPSWAIPAVRGSRSYHLGKRQDPREVSTLRELRRPTWRAMPLVRTSFQGRKRIGRASASAARGSRSTRADSSSLWGGTPRWRCSVPETWARRGAGRKPRPPLLYGNS